MTLTTASANGVAPALQRGVSQLTRAHRSIWPTLYGMRLASFLHEANAAISTGCPRTYSVVCKLLAWYRDRMADSPDAGHKPPTAAAKSPMAPVGQAGPVHGDPSGLADAGAGNPLRQIVACSGVFELAAPGGPAAPEWFVQPGLDFARSVNQSNCNIREFAADIFHGRTDALIAAMRRPVESPGGWRKQAVTKTPAFLEWVAQWLPKVRFRPAPSPLQASAQGFAKELAQGLEQQGIAGFERESIEQGLTEGLKVFAKQVEALGGDKQAISALTQECIGLAAEVGQRRLILFQASTGAVANEGSQLVQVATHTNRLTAEGIERIKRAMASGNAAPALPIPTETQMQLLGNVARELEAVQPNLGWIVGKFESGYITRINGYYFTLFAKGEAVVLRVEVPGPGQTIAEVGESSFAIGSNSPSQLANLIRDAMTRFP